MERGSGGGGSLELAGGGGGGGGNTDLCLQDLVTGSTTGLSVQHHQHSAAAASMAGLHGDHLQGTMHHHDLHGNSHHNASMLHDSSHQLHEPLEKLKRGESVTISRVVHRPRRSLLSSRFAARAKETRRTRGKRSMDRSFLESGQRLLVSFRVVFRGGEFWNVTRVKIAGIPRS